MKAHMGIDPGATGAACLIADEGVYFIDMKKSTPSEVVSGVCGWKCQFNIKIAVLEQVGAMPGQGVTSMFNFGRGYGWWQGVLDALVIPWRLARPQSWQKGLGADKSKGKAGLVEVAERLFPMADFRGPKGGVLSGRADAALIADWARRNG